MTEHGCLDCLSLENQNATFTIEDERTAYFCPYCGNRNFIETGDEWDEVVERYE
jgi:DNA-directed RNA polymerase subunit RPC12/RpoP